MAKTAIVLRSRGINHAGVHHPHRSIIRDMPDGRFEDWRNAGLVRRPTPAEYRAAKRGS